MNSYMMFWLIIGICFIGLIIYTIWKKWNDLKTLHEMFLMQVFKDKWKDYNILDKNSKASVTTLFKQKK